MKQTSVIEGVGIALLLTAIAAPINFALRAVFAGGVGLKLTLLGLTTLYVGYLLWTTPRRPGQILLAVFGLSLFTILAGLNVSVATLCFIIAGSIWLVRAVTRYSSLISGGLDLLLTLSSLTGAWWAYSVSASVIAAIWVFLFTQALTALIPRKPGISQSASRKSRQCNQFDHAYRAAQSAIESLMG